MATTTLYFRGQCKWAMVHRMDEKFQNYKINLFMDDASKDLFKTSGLQLKPKREIEGEKDRECDISDPDAYVVFRRDDTKEIKGDIVKFGKPKVYDEEGNLTQALIGNGSTVTIKVSAFDTQNGVGHRLEDVWINELVPYEGKGENAVRAPEGLDLEAAPF